MCLITILAVDLSSDGTWFFLDESFRRKMREDWKGDEFVRSSFELLSWLRRSSNNIDHAAKPWLIPIYL